MNQSHIFVIGSLNADLVMRAPRLPRPGETVVGAAFHVAPGGKGANQAVAAARLGAPVAMLGRIGDDSFGRLVCAELIAAGIDAGHVQVDGAAATGTAQIVVDERGHNTIVVASGANARVEVTDVVKASAWNGAALLVLQLEIPLVTVAAAIATAVTRGVPVLLNAAPAQALPAALVEHVTWLVMNEIEAEQLTGRALASPADVEAAIRDLRQPGQRVLVTLGGAGAVLINDSGVLHVPAPVVDVIDTTAAGDACVGALAAALYRGMSDDAAVRTAVIASSLACTKLGAIPSLPTVAEMRAATPRDRVE